MFNSTENRDRRAASCLRVGGNTGHKIFSGWPHLFAVGWSISGSADLCLRAAVKWNFSVQFRSACKNATLMNECTAAAVFLPSRNSCYRGRGARDWGSGRRQFCLTWWVLFVLDLLWASFSFQLSMIDKLAHNWVCFQVYHRNCVKIATFCPRQIRNKVKKNPILLNKITPDSKRIC